MQYRSTTREESPSHQQLFRRNASLSGQPRRSSVTPSRNNYALAVVPPGSGADAASPHADEMVYVADVNPVYSVSAAVRCLAPVNDRVMWSAEFNGSLSVRALPKGTVLRTLPGREGTCCISLMYLPESDQMWAGFQDGYLHVYNARTMDLVTETMAHAGGLNCMVQVDDSVFTGGTDWKVTQWSVDGANGAVRQQRTLHGHRGGVRCFAVYDGPTGSVLFSGSDDGTIRAWDPYPAEGDGKKKSSNNNDSSGVPAANIHTFTGHRRAVLSLCVVSHMNQVWSGGEDMTVRVWDMQTLECLSVLRSGHTAPVANLMLVESRVWSADKHGHVLLWDVLTRSLLQDLADRVPYWGIGQGMIMAMGKVQPTTAYKVWTASSNGVLQCWNAETIPIVFDDVPVAAGAFQGTGAGMMGSNDHLTAAAAGGNGSELNTPTGRHGAAAKDSAEVAGMNVSTANRSTNNPNTPTGCGAAAGADGSDDTSSPARMHEYVQQLQAELQDTQRDAKMAYEKYRLEVQLEVETQQLLSEENARLRERVQELEGMVGERPRELTSEPATSALDSAAAQQQQPMMVAELEAWQAEVDSLRQQLDEANRQLEEALQQQNQQHRDESPSTMAERSPEPLQPFSHVREAAAAAAPALEDAEKARLQQQLAKAAADNKRLMDANARQRVEAHQHQRSMEKLQEQLKATQAELDHLREEHDALDAYVHDTLKPTISSMERARDELKVDKQRLLDQLAATEKAPLTSSDADVQQQLEDFAALQAYVHDQLKPMIARLKRARGELTLDKDRLLEKLAAAEEKLAAAAGDSTERAPLTSSDADVQQQLEDFAALQAYVHDQLKPMIARLKRARGELTLDKDRLLEKLAAAEEKLAAAAGDSTERAPLTSSDADVQQQLEDFAALQAYVHDQLKPMIARLKRARGELTLDKDRLLEKLAAAEEKLAAAAGDSTERAPLTSSDADVQQQLEDFAALQAYVHDQLKPMIARLKRARGELTLDKDRLLEKLAAAEEKLAAAAGDSTERAPLTSSDADVQQQLEDFAALQAYVHDQLKPMIARLKRARGELTLDKDRLLEKLAAAEEKLAAAAGDSTERAPLTSSDADVQQQLEDFAALQAYVHDQLKPMIARLKRARGELTLDKDRLLEKLAAAEEKLAAAAGDSTERAPLTSSDADVQQQLEDFAALQAYVHDQLKPMIARLKRARGELTLDKDRLLEKLAAAEEKLAAAAGDSTERAPLTSSDADVQQQLEDFAALQAYVHDQLKPMIARLKRARGELTLDKDRLLEKLAAAEEKLAAAAGDSTERAPLTSSDADVQQQLEDFAALQAYVHDQLKPMIARLKRARGELTLDKDRLLEKLAAAEEKLAAAAGDSTERAPLTSSDADVQQQLEDFAALQAYVHDQLKPMIARLKRARGELTLDKDRLLEKLAAAEEKLAAAAGDSTERAPLTSSDADVQQQLEDFAALQAYVHDQLKPMIARLKRARGELTLDKERLADDLRNACELYEDASAALEESRVREEKMGETLDALQKALEAEQQKNQRLVEALEGAGVPPESVTGRKTEAALLNPNEHHNRRDDGQARDSAATVGEASPSGLGQDDEDAKVRASLDRLAAQNLDLSVRLADAETVIAQLQNSLLTAGDASRPKQ